MNRRDFLKGIAGVTAAGIALPGEEVVRRFWRGWSPRHGDRHPIMAPDVPPNLITTIMRIETGQYDAELRREYLLCKRELEDAMIYGAPLPEWARPSLNYGPLVSWDRGERG